MNEYLEERDEKGFTLIELLIAIVVVVVSIAVDILNALVDPRVRY